MHTSIEHLAAQHALYSGLARWQPASACSEDIELARPHLAPALTWSRIVGDRDGELTHAELRCALFAIDLLVGSVVSQHDARYWLAHFGATPLSTLATDAVHRLAPKRQVLCMDDYIRAMSCYSTVGVWEYVLARTFADVISPNTNALHVLGKTASELWSEFRVAWATRPSIRLHPHTNPNEQS